MMEDPVHLHIEQLISQRIGEPSIQFSHVETREQAAMSLLVALGPEQPDEMPDRVTARTYLSRIVDGEPVKKPRRKTP
jgi:hypothetical protein